MTGRYGAETKAERQEIDQFYHSIRTSFMPSTLQRLESLPGVRSATECLPGTVHVVGGDKETAERYRRIGILVRHFATQREHLKGCKMKLCPNCGARRFLSISDIDFVRCAECRLLIRQYPPDLELALKEAHDARGDSYRPPPTDSRAFNGALFVCRYAPELSRGRTLDVGCGWGHFVELMGDRASGIDASARHVAHAQHTLGLDVRQGRFDAKTMIRLFGGASFDLISFFSSLIYMDDVGAALDLSRELLTDRGALLVCDLQADSPYYWFGKPLLSRSGQPATAFFDRRTLKDALARRGFEIVASQSYPMPVGHAIDGWGLSPLWARFLPPFLSVLPADFRTVLARRMR